MRREYENNILGFVEECDRRIRAAQKRLEKTPEENNRTTALVSHPRNTETLLKRGGFCVWLVWVCKVLTINILDVWLLVYLKRDRCERLVKSRRLMRVQWLRLSPWVSILGFEEFSFVLNQREYALR